MEPIIGIDLGTTNSEVAVCVNGKIEIVEKDGNPVLPSYVGLSPDSKLLIGEEARNQYILYPENTVKSIKRKMGRNEKIKLGNKTYLPQEISAILLKELKSRAEKYLNRKVKKAVITVPAQFSDVQRQATREAGIIAGLEVVRIINEPTAASLAFKSNDIDKSSYVLVYDLGGGTFDVSLLKMEGELIEVVASHGDNMLGGDDFDQALSEWIQDKLLENNDKHIELSMLSKYRLNRIAENTKAYLSDFTHAKVIESGFDLIDTDKTLSINEEISRIEFEELIECFLDKTILAVHQTLADAGVNASEIDDIVLVGGSTRIPSIADALEREFGKKPRKNVHPELAVAYGAGIMAARLMGEKKHRILIDITPYSFGISCMGMVDGVYCPYKYVPVIKSGTPLPVSKEELFYTMCEAQDAVKVNVFQGENTDARKNILIGKFRVENLSLTAPEGSEIAMNMRLDLDGILKVAAVEVETGLTKHITINDTLSKLSDIQLIDSAKEIIKLFNEEDLGAVDIDFDEDETAKDNSIFYKLKKRVQAAVSKMDEADRIEADKLLLDIENAQNINNDVQLENLITELDDLLFYVEVE